VKEIGPGAPAGYTYNRTSWTVSDSEWTWGYDPEYDEQLVTGMIWHNGEGISYVTFTNYYTRNPNDPVYVSYTVVHEFYLEVLDGKVTLEGSTSSSFGPYQNGTFVDPDGIARVYTYGGNSYSFTGIDRAGLFYVSSNGTVITLKYLRVLTPDYNPTPSSVTVVHEYYFKDLDGNVTLEGSTSSLDSRADSFTINADAIARVLTYGGNGYDFQSIDRTGVVTVNGHGTVITLTYLREEIEIEDRETPGDGDPIDIGDPETPGDVPDTGDSILFAVFAVIATLGLAVLGAVSFIGRKGKAR